MDEKVAHARSWMRPVCFFSIVLMRDGLWAGWIVGGLMAIGMVIEQIVSNTITGSWKTPLLTGLGMGFMGWILGMLEGFFLALVAGWRPLTLLDIRHSRGLQWLIGGSWFLMVWLIALVVVGGPWSGMSSLVIGLGSLGVTSLGAWLAYRAGVRAIREYAALVITPLPPAARYGVGLLIDCVRDGVRRCIPYVLLFAVAMALLDGVSGSFVNAGAAFLGSLIVGIGVAACAGLAFGFWLIYGPFPLTLDSWKGLVLWSSVFVANGIAFVIIDALQRPFASVQERNAMIGLCVGSVWMVASIAIEVRKLVIINKRNPEWEAQEADFERLYSLSLQATLIERQLEISPPNQAELQIQLTEMREEIAILNKKVLVYGIDGTQSMIEWCKAHSKPEARITEYEQQLSLQRQKLAMILQLEHNPPDAASIHEKISEINEALDQIFKKNWQDYQQNRQKASKKR